MRTLMICVVALTAGAALAAPAPAGTIRSIKVGDNYYVRDGAVPTVTVKRGTTVVWRFAGRSAHTVTVSKAPSGVRKFSSRAQTSGTYRRTLKTKGTYRIYCDIHGARDQSMTLRVTS